MNIRKISNLKLTSPRFDESPVAVFEWDDGWVADIAADPWHILHDATWLGCTEDSPPQLTVAPGARGPRPSPARERAREAEMYSQGVAVTQLKR